MEELSILKEENKETRINSVELVEIINQFRQLESEMGNKEYRQLRHKYFMKKVRKELEVLKTLGFGNEGGISLVKYKDIKGEKRPCYFLNSQGVKHIMDSCKTRDKIAMVEVFNSMSNGQEVSICKNRPEYEFIDGVINALKPFGIERFETQFYVCNKYKIDLYIPSLNIAIEFDEKQHNSKISEDEFRQMTIEKELNCKFIRVKETDNLFFNIGLVLREASDSLNSRSPKNIKEVA